MDRLADRAGDGHVEAADDLAVLDLGRLVVDRQQEARAVEQLLDRRLLAALGAGMVAGDLRLVGAGSGGTGSTIWFWMS